MSPDQSAKLDAINKILSVVQPEAEEAATRSEEWSRKLGFARRMEEILVADTEAKRSTASALKKVSEDVTAGKL